MHETEHNGKQSMPRPNHHHKVSYVYPFAPKKRRLPLTRSGRLNGRKRKKVYGRYGINSISCQGLLLADLEPSCRFNLCLVARQYEQHAVNKRNSGSKQELYHYRLSNTYRKVIPRVNSAYHQMYKKEREREKII